MKNLVRFFLFLVILFIFASVFSVLSNKAFAQSYVEKQAVTGANLLKNPGFESGKGGWTISGTLFTNSTTNAMPPGKYSGRFTLTSYSGTLLEQSVSDCSKLSGQNLEASIYVKSATSDISVCSLSGSTEVQCQAVSPVNSFTQVILNFPAPSSGSCGIRVKTTASVTGTPEVDAAYLGLARNIGTVAQAEVRVTAIGNGSPLTVNDNAEAAVTNWTETFDSYSEFSGGIFTAKKPGSCSLYAAVRFNALTTPVRANAIVYKNGVFQTGRQQSDGTRPNPSVEWTGPVSVGDTLQVYAFQDSAGNNSIDGSVTQQFLSIKCFPTQSELAIRPQDAAFMVDANISGANPDLGTSAVTSYTEITNGSLTLTPASGSAPVGIMCSSTNAAATPSTSPTTCSAGSESVGFNVNVPKAGVYEVCGYFAHGVSVNSGAGVSVAFQWVQTPANAQTNTSLGGTRLNSGYNALTVAGVTSGATSLLPQTNCAIFSIASTGVTGFRLMYEQTVSGTPSSNVLVADSSATVGQRDIRITMRPWLGNANAPLLVQSVVAGDNTTGVTTINKVREVTASTYTATTDDETLKLNTASNDITVTLPAAASVPGKKYEIFVSSSSNRAIIDPNSSETVCGNSTISVFGLEDTVTLQSDGTNWIGLNGSCSRQFSAYINNNGTCSVVEDSPVNWISSVSRPGTGNCTISGKTGLTSTAPKCICTANDTAASAFSCTLSVSSATSFTVGVTASGTTATDRGFQVMCSGPR